MAKLYANDDFAGRDLRDKNGHAEGFTKIGQLYGKLKWEEDTPAALPVGNSWRAQRHAVAQPPVPAGHSRETGNGRLAAVTRFSERDEPEKRGFYTLKSNKPIDYIVTGEMSWSPTKYARMTRVAGETSLSVAQG
ncbi:hypothetical protein CWS02_09070 [Enterobacter sp. EA-1]|nr:hypothetical protein CWS02_09070 [Enterobacter sp. EA-1]